MRPTFLGFETARKGLVVNQKGIDITGQNLTNIHTPGYTRQRVDMVSMSTSSGNRYATKPSGLAGQGVTINGISQARDPFLDKRFREEYSSVGYYDQTSAILGDIESALDELTSNGLKSGLESLMTAFQNFSKNPDQATHANIVLTASKNMTQILKQFDTKLNNIMEQQKFNLGIAVNDVNAILEKVANLNQSISSDLFISGNSSIYGPNELLDQRNVLLDQLAKYGDMNVIPNADGTVKVEMNGHVVVDNTYYETLNMVRNHDNTVTVSWQSNGQPVDFLGGTIKAMTDMINGRGPAATGYNENYEKGVPYYKDKIDDFARMLVKVFNSTMETKATTAQYQISPPNSAHTGTKSLQVQIDGNSYDITLDHPTDGTTVATQAASIAAKMNAHSGINGKYTVEATSDGRINVTAKQEGRDVSFGGITGWNSATSAQTSFITVVRGVDAGEATKVLFQPEDASQVTAGNITVSDIWNQDPKYIITDIDNDGKADNTYILALINALNTDHNFGEFTGTFEQYVNSYNSTLGQQKEFSDSRLDASAAIADEMLNRRDAVSGVSMDEEGANLMVYDKAYKAVSRLMTTLDEALDILINRTGMVGR